MVQEVREVHLSAGLCQHAQPKWTSLTLLVLIRRLAGLPSICFLIHGRLRPSFCTFLGARWSRTPSAFRGLALTT